MREFRVFVCAVYGILEGGYQGRGAAGIMNAHAAPHRRLHNGLVVEGRDDPEVVSTTA
jgi:hypothetical protein